MPKITVNGNLAAGAKALRGASADDKGWRLWLDIFPSPEELAQVAALAGKALRVTLED